MNNDLCIQIFCQNVKYLRAKNRLSKKNMAHILGIGIGSLNKLEQGILPPTLGCNILFHILNAFALYPHEMFSPLEQKKD
jgi:transcriptional regulator with XRE-family HTH domain